MAFQRPRSHGETQNLLKMKNEVLLTVSQPAWSHRVHPKKLCVTRSFQDWGLQPQLKPNHGCHGHPVPGESPSNFQPAFFRLPQFNPVTSCPSWRPGAPSTCLRTAGTHLFRHLSPDYSHPTHATFWDRSSSLIVGQPSRIAQPLFQCLPC